MPLALKEPQPYMEGLLGHPLQRLQVWWECCGVSIFMVSFKRQQLAYPGNERLLFAPCLFLFLDSTLQEVFH